MKRLSIYFSIIFLLFATSVATAEGYEEKLLENINGFRIENGLDPLLLDPLLCLIARDYSDVLVSIGELSHTAMDDNEWNKLSAHYGIDRHCFELLVYAPEIPPDPLISFECLRDSPLHRAGLITPEGVVCGIGVSKGFNCSYVTVYIGGPDRKGVSYGE